jgi:glycosyl-4,4'-diaponeurosporenoate acyltransferase
VLIELPMVWIAVLNVVGWLVVQLGLAWGFTRMPDGWFRRGAGWEWERGGRVYERVLGIKRWKGRLPDGARWFGGGFAKGGLEGRDGEYLERFVRETWRGELCHWVAMAWVPVFFLWNPWWGCLINLVYALGANLPCVLAQRYNRARLMPVIERSGRRRGG